MWASSVPFSQPSLGTHTPVVEQVGFILLILTKKNTYHRKLQCISGKGCWKELFIGFGPMLGDF